MIPYKRAPYCPLPAKISAMCSLSHSRSFRTAKLKSSSSSLVNAIACRLSSKIQSIVPIAGAFARVPAISDSVGEVAFPGDTRVGGGPGDGKSAKKVVERVSLAAHCSAIMAAARCGRWHRRLSVV